MTTGYNTPNVDVPLPYLLGLPNLRDLYVEDNVRKRPFLNEQQLQQEQTYQATTVIESKMSPTNPYGPTESIAKVHIYSQTASIYCFFYFTHYKITH